MRIKLPKSFNNLRDHRRALRGAAAVTPKTIAQFMVKERDYNLTMTEIPRETRISTRITMMTMART